MITEKTTYGCKCDSCEKEWQDDFYGTTTFPDPDSMHSRIQTDDLWTAEEDKHYCEGCSAIRSIDNFFDKELKHE